MLEDIKNRLLKFEIEPKNTTIICKEALPYGRPAWMVCMYATYTLLKFHFWEAFYVALNYRWYNCHV